MDWGTEYCGWPESHDYELYLAIENIDHTRTKVKGPHTNGICERFHKTVLEEFYRMAASAVYGFAFLLLEVSDAAVREGKHLGVRRQLAPLTLGRGPPKLEVDQCE
jgi:transposase InsO family protein